MNDKIRELQRQIESEQRKISSCNHLFGDSYYNPETVKESYGYRTVVQGSDIWGEPEGYRDVKKDRWSRKCSICGYEQHTNKQEPVITKYIPKFE